MTISVSLVVVLDNNTVAVTEPSDAKIYPETLPGANYKQCISVGGLNDPASVGTKEIPGELRDWVKKHPVVVLIHNPAPNVIDGDAVGLTALEPFTGTKTTKAMTNAPVRPITVADLQNGGFI